MRSKKWKREEGEGKKASLFLSSPLPPRSFACAIFRAVFDSRSSFFAPKPHRNACYACYLVGSPGGPGGEVLPIMESFFSNNGQIMHMNIISLILVWHCCWASNTRWLEKILKVLLRSNLGICFLLRISKMYVKVTYRATFGVQIWSGSVFICTAIFVNVLPPLLDSKNDRE